MPQKRVCVSKEPGFSAVANVTTVVCIGPAKTMEKNCIFWSCLVPWMELFNAMIDSVIDWANKQWNLLGWFDWNHELLWVRFDGWTDNSPIPRLPSQAYLTFVSSCLVEDIVEHQAYIPNVHQHVANTSQIDDKKSLFSINWKVLIVQYPHLSPFCNSSKDTLYIYLYLTCCFQRYIFFVELHHFSSICPLETPLLCCCLFRLQPFKSQVLILRQLL